MLNHYLIEPPLATNLAKKKHFLVFQWLPANATLNDSWCRWCGLIGGNQAQVSQCSMGGTGPIAASHIPCYGEKQLQPATRDMLQITPRGGHPAIQRPALYCCICGEKAIVSSKWINDQTISCLHHEAATFTDATDFKRLHLTWCQSLQGAKFFQDTAKCFFPSKVTTSITASTTITDMSRAFPRDVASSSPHRNLLTVRLFRFS